MKSLGRVLLLPCLMACLVASTSFAQPPGERGGRGGDRGPGGRGGPGGPGGRGGPGGPGGPGNYERMMGAMSLLTAIDADKNGEISKAEIENASKALLTLDKNKDGTLTLEELRPEFARGRGPGGPGGPGGERGRGGRGGPGGPGGGSPEAAVERMMQMDKDKDGLLSSDELPERMKQMLTRADKDDDGKISKDELTAAIKARMGGGGFGRGRGGPGGRGGDAAGGERPRRPESE